MKRPAFRVVLLLIASVAGAVGGVLYWDLDTRILAERTSAQSVRERAQTLTAGIAELRASQQAYIALGQREAFWMERVAARLPDLARQMTEFPAALASAEAHSAAEAASKAVENFQKMDARAREHVLAGESLAASDLIFSDGLDATTAAATEIESAAKLEVQARDANVTAMHQRQVLVLGGALAVGFLGLLSLWTTGRSAEATAVAAAVETAVTPPQPESIRTAPGPNLGRAAALCTDLAKVQDAHELPGLLERTARIIDASGLIVWLADPTGRELRPAMAYGYSDLVVASMGRIQRDAANATAAAYRTAEPRTVTSDGVASGAVVVPLMTPDGCVGVLSAELKGGREKNPAAQALTAIVAAQLATLVVPAASPRTAAQA